MDKLRIRVVKLQHVIDILRLYFSVIWIWVGESGAVMCASVYIIIIVIHMRTRLEFIYCNYFFNVKTMYAMKVLCTAT